jgi:aspartate carbamoyltransferase catalytic subunit
MFIRHVLESKQFRDREVLERLFRESEKMEKLSGSGKLPQLMKGKVMASLFYEPSTRTRLSFESAMTRLGGSVIGTEAASHFSSAVKGESLTDTIKIIGRYADIIVIRHPQEGSARLASEASPIPVINGGDGPGQHPTQALLDMYTIKKELGRIDDLSIAMVGDLFYGRTVHSLTYLLAQQNGVRLYFVSPDQLKIPKRIKTFLKEEKNIPFEETTSLEDVAPKADVLYITRIQKERFSNEEEYNKLKGCYVINNQILKLMKDKAIIMHPLPRVEEIANEVDSDPRAAYFRQAENGLYIRMALLNMILGDGK